MSAKVSKRTAKRLAKKFTALAASIVIASTVMPTTAQAGLKEAMNKLFIGAATNPQPINTQRLNGIYGGSMTLRPVSGGVNVVQFAPPRLDAGCGGVDIFFGSFSFINGAQFEQLIRSIAASAVGFAIKAAIDKMCSPCGKLISELEAAMRELNAMAKNTCAIGSAIFSKDLSKLSERSAQIGTHLKAAGGHVSDIIKSIGNRQAENSNETATGGGAGGTTSSVQQVSENNELNGNIVWRASKQTLNRGGNTLRAFMSEKEVIEIVMGLYGTVIYNPPKEQSCPQGATDAACKNDPIITEPTIIRYEQLMKPRSFFEDGVPVLRCLNNDCTRIDSGGRISFSVWGGSEEFINMALYGTKTVPATASETSPDSLVGIFYHQNASGSFSLNSQARALDVISPVPISRVFMEVQRIPNGPMLLAHQIGAVLPEFVAYQMATEIHGIGANVFSQQTAVTMPDSYERNLKAKADELNAMKPDKELLMGIFNNTVQSIKSITLLTRSNNTIENAPKN